MIFTEQELTESLVRIDSENTDRSEIPTELATDVRCSLMLAAGTLEDIGNGKRVTKQQREQAAELAKILARDWKRMRALFPLV